MMHCKKTRSLKSTMLNKIVVLCVAFFINLLQHKQCCLNSKTSASFIQSIGDCQALRATLSEGSSVYLPYTFSVEGTYHLDVTAANRDINTVDVQQSVLINVTEGINTTIIEGPLFVKTGVLETFYVAPHTGNFSNIILLCGIYFCKNEF